MKRTHQSHGKILEHFEGMGTVTRDTVVERAREIALINGRGPNHYTQDDFAQAKLELTGAGLDGQGEEDGEGVAGLVTWDEPPTAAGRAVEKAVAQDEQTYAEELVEEGVEEAEHEQMVEGAKEPHNQE